MHSKADARIQQLQTKIDMVAGAYVSTQKRNE
jgi:hypothetical protein